VCGFVQDITSLAAFDPLAPIYDADFTRSPIAQHLRARVQERLDRLCAPGDAVLELGCGTGEDALHLARRGVHVLATDASEAMLTVARGKLADYANARVERMDLRDLRQRNTAGAMNGVSTDSSDLANTPSESLFTQSSALSTQHFSLVFANFGVLNCLDDWRPLAAWLANIVPVGGQSAFAVMPPACLWEVAWHGAHGEWGVATRRWRRGGAAFGVTHGENADNAVAMAGKARLAPTIRYPTVRRMTRDFAPWFRRVYVEPLGLLLPPSDIYGVIEKRPRLLRMLTRLDDSCGRLSLMANFADHYWIEFRRF
jgi:SAM-dependent methyltransferase